MHKNLIAVLATATLALSGCGVREIVVPATTPAPATSVTTSVASTSTSAAIPASQNAVFPEFPPIVIPDVTALTTSSTRFATALRNLATPVSGISVQGARCDAKGKVVNRGSLTEVNNGDGSGTFADGALQVTNNGDGSGTYRDGALQITVATNGSGTLSDGALQIVINGDGSGTYSDGALEITIGSNGSGTYSDGALRIVNNGDGSGTYGDGALRVVNNGDGSGTHSDGALQAVNNGDGTGTVDGVPTTMAPLAPLPELGRFPKAGALAPVGKACGTLLRLSDRVLFDFAKAVLRPAAGPVLDEVARALDGVAGPVTVNGHTDAKGSDADNLDLAQRRADAVVAGLRQRGVATRFETNAFGESQPIAPNELNGKDNPAGRALNRRVEIIVPG
jgi:OmpA-OmpF porin, OOP family